MALSRRSARVWYVMRGAQSVVPQEFEGLSYPYRVVSIAESKVIRRRPSGLRLRRACATLVQWPPLVWRDALTFACGSVSELAAKQGGGNSPYDSYSARSGVQ